MPVAGERRIAVIFPPGVLLSSLATLLILAPAARCHAQRAPSLVGTWSGGFDLGGGPGSIGIRVRESGSGFLRPFVPPGDTLAIRIESSMPGHASFVAGTGGTSLRFRGALENGRLTGTVWRGRERGRFELVRTVAIPGARLQGYIGDYDAGTGRTLVIGRSLSALYSLEPDSGYQAPLIATSDSTFIGGATVGTSYPFLSTFRFERDGAGIATGVHWRRGSGPERFAPRIRPYDELEVTFASDTVRLAGAALLPRSPGLHPGVVLVHGSNAQSRNGQESIYRFHADHFARRGIAVLIYDKRGIGGSSGYSSDPGLERDVLAAVRMLRAQSGVDSTRIGLWGLSQGAWLVGQAAALAPGEVAFIIPVGGGALNPHVQEIRRTEMMMRADGFGEAQIRDATALQTLKFRYARRRDNWDEYLAAVERAKGQKWLDDPYIGPPTSKDSPAWDFWQRGIGSGAVEPADYLTRVRCPVLAIDGALDAYGGSPETLTLIDTYLDHGGNQNVSLRLLPSGSHAIYEARTGGPREQPYLTRFVPGYLDMMSEWILKRSARR